MQLNSLNHFLKLTFLVLCGTLLIGCKLKLDPGNYHAILFDSTDKSPSQSFGLKELVQVELTYPEKRQAKLIVKTREGAERFQLTLKKGLSRDITFWISNLLEKPIRLEPIQVKLGSDVRCYQSYQAYHFLACYGDQDFQLSVKNSRKDTVLSLTAALFDQGRNFELEAPRVLTSDDAIRISVEKNFSSRLEYQRLITAKENARAAYLSLLPQVRTSSAVGIFALSWALVPFPILGELGNFAPFLLPNRWLDARAAQYEQEAKRQAVQIMRANLASNVETLLYTFWNHKTLLHQYQVVQNILNEAYPIYSKFDEEKKTVMGSSNALQSSLKSLKVNIDELKIGLSATLMDIAEALGFNNPLAVEDVVQTHRLPDPEKARPLNREGLLQAVVNRSLELKQYDFLIEAAHKRKQALYFSGADPASQQLQGFGPGQIGRVRVGKSITEETILKQNEIQQGLVFSTQKILERYHQSLSNYFHSKDLFELQEQRLWRAQQQLVRCNGSCQENNQSSGTEHRFAANHFDGFTSFEFNSIVQDYLSALVLRETSLTNFRIAYTQLERMLVIGVYRRLGMEGYDDLMLEHFEIGNRVES